MKTTKIILLLATVLLLGLLATSCIPTTPTGGNPEPTLVNQFNINITDQSLAYDEQYIHPSNAAIRKYLSIDGDSIKFKIIRSNYWVPRQDFTISFKNANLNVQFLTIINPTEPTNTYKILKPVLANVNIPFGIASDTTLTWSNQYYLIGNPNNIYYYDSDGFNTGYESSDISNRGYHGITVGDVRYIIFRKLKGSDYQYYWVKLQYNANNFSVLYGNYQLGNITTGQ